MWSSTASLGMFRICATAAALVAGFCVGAQISHPRAVTWAVQLSGSMVACARKRHLVHGVDFFGRRGESPLDVAIIMQ